MARPTLEEQIAKAAEEGNLEKVRELAKRLKKPPLKAKQKTKSKQKKQAVKTPPQEELPAQIREERRIIIPGGSYEYEKYKDYLTTSKKVVADVFDDDEKEEESPAKSGRKGGKVSRVLPFDTSKKINQWKDTKREELGDAKIDKLLGANKARQVETREPVKKISVKCKKCKQMCLVWPGEVLHSRWTCDDCLSDH
jgi:hypothetical protein